MTRLTIPLRYVYMALVVSGGTLALGAGFQTGRSATPDVSPQSVQQTMDLMIDPAVDSLWETVGIEETAKGTRVKAPHTEGEWLKLAGYAKTLADGAKRLQTPSLPVGANAHSKLADADTPGTRTAAQIRADIDANPYRFREAAIHLEEASNQALKAAHAHDVSGVLAAGAALDAACEACHAAYWYPRTAPLRLPSPNEFATKAIGRR